MQDKKTEPNKGFANVLLYLIIVGLGSALVFFTLFLGRNIQEPSRLLHFYPEASQVNWTITKSANSKLALGIYLDFANVDQEDETLAKLITIAQNQANNYSLSEIEYQGEREYVLATVVAEQGSSSSLPSFIYQNQVQFIASSTEILGLIRQYLLATPKLDFTQAVFEKIVELRQPTYGKFQEKFWYATETEANLRISFISKDLLRAVYTLFFKEKKLAQLPDFASVGFLNKDLTTEKEFISSQQLNNILAPQKIYILKQDQAAAQNLAQVLFLKNSQPKVNYVFEYLASDHQNLVFSLQEFIKTTLPTLSDSTSSNLDYQNFVAREIVPEPLSGQQAELEYEYYTLYEQNIYIAEIEDKLYLFTNLVDLDKLSVLALTPAYYSYSQTEDFMDILTDFQLDLPNKWFVEQNNLVINLN